MAAKIHLDPWTDIVNVGWASPAPFMCFNMDIRRGPTHTFQVNMNYDQPYDWSSDVLVGPVTTLENPSYGRFVTAVRFIWHSRRIEKRGTYSSADPQEGTWSGGVRDFTSQPIDAVYRLVGSSWQSVTIANFAPAGLPSLPDTRTLTRGVAFAG
jgi:hypothetical protein